MKRKGLASRQSQQFVCLKAQAPLGVIEAISDSKICILQPIAAIHWLEEEVRERHCFILLRFSAWLREDQFEFIARREQTLHSGFGADAYPVDPVRRNQCSIGFDTHLKTRSVERSDHRTIELQQRLSPGAHYIRISMVGTSRPMSRNSVSEFFSSGKETAAGPVRAKEVRIAKRADCTVAIVLASAPEVASTEAAKHCSPAGLRPFPLQGIIYFLYRVGHVPLSTNLIENSEYQRVPLNASSIAFITIEGVITSGNTMGSSGFPSGKMT